jgi:hypothetical protein
MDINGNSTISGAGDVDLTGVVSRIGNPDPISMGTTSTDDVKIITNNQDRIIIDGVSGDIEFKGQVSQEITTHGKVITDEIDFIKVDVNPCTVLLEPSKAETLVMKTSTKDYITFDSIDETVKIDDVEIDTLESKSGTLNLVGTNVLKIDDNTSLSIAGIDTLLTVNDTTKKVRINNFDAEDIILDLTM